MASRNALVGRRARLQNRWPEYPIQFLAPGFQRLHHLGDIVVAIIDAAHSFEYVPEDAFGNVRGGAHLGQPRANRPSQIVKGRVRNA